MMVIVTLGLMKYGTLAHTLSQGDKLGILSTMINALFIDRSVPQVQITIGRRNPTISEKQMYVGIILWTKNASRYPKLILSLDIDVTRFLMKMFKPANRAY